MRHIQLLLIITIALLLTACAGSRPAIDIPKEQPLQQEKISQPDVALVLGGGGARGFAHIGVIKVLHDAGVPINLMAGTSAGSIFGIVYADRGSYPQLDKAFSNVGLWTIADLNNFPKREGIMQGYHLQKFLLKHLHAKTFKQLKIPFIVATTDLATGTVYKIDSGPVAPAVQASGAVPGLFNPVHLYGHTLIDGGMADPVAVDLVKPYHPKLIIAVNIAKQLSGPTPTMADDIYKRAGVIRQLAVTRMSTLGADVVIRPQVGDTNIFAISKKDFLIKEGEKAAKKALPKILKLLKEKNIPLKKGKRHI